jgi:tellurite resistance protein
MSKELAKVFGHNSENNDDSANSTGFSGRFWFAAVVMLAAAIVSAISNWMATIELYEMAGDAWCPAKLDSLALI